MPFHVTVFLNRFCTFLTTESKFSKVFVQLSLPGVACARHKISFSLFSAYSKCFRPPCKWLCTILSFFVRYQLVLTALSVHSDIVNTFWCHWHVHRHKNLLLRDWPRILSKRLGFAGHPRCFAICSICFENVLDVLQIASKIREMYKTYREKL